MRFVFVLLFCCGVQIAEVSAGSSNSLMGITPNGEFLLVANTDNNSVSLLDLSKNQKVREIKVGDQPQGVAWVQNGPLSLVTLYREDRVVLVDTQKGEVIQKIDKLNEPYGIVTTRDGKRAYVSLDYPGSIAEIDVENHKVTRIFPVGEWLRGIAISTDEKRLYATNFYTAELYAVEIATGKVVDRWTSHEDDNLCRHVELHPTRPKAYLSHLRSRVEVFDASGSIFPYATICDTRSEKSVDTRRRSLKMDSYFGTYVVSDPWEAAITPDGKKLFTIYAATNDLFTSEVIHDDYTEISRLGYPITVGKTPRAVKVSPNGKMLYIYTALDFAVQVIRIDGMKKEASIKTCEPPHTAEWVRGNYLFHTSTQPMSARRWVACSSCHPGGAPDHRTWHNPEGLRKTPPLFGLAHTHPLHWSADRDEVQDFEYTIRGKLMGGRGLTGGSRIKPRTEFQSPSELEEKLSGRSEDLDALAVYSNSFTFRLSPHIPAAGQLSDAAKRGQKLFASKAVGCADCHQGPYYSNSSLQKPFKLHDVGTGNDPDEKMGPKYDTPTLLGIYRSAPYLHHGKAKDLMEVLTKYNPKDQHGKTSQLSQVEKEDLVAFLKSLPFELPPDETPNSVPYRLKAEPRRKK